MQSPDRTQEARERAIRGAALEIGVEVAVQRMIAAEAKVAALEAEARRSRIDSPEAVAQLAHDVAGMEAWDNDTEVSFPLGEVRATLDRVSTLETALRDLRAIANREVLAEHGLRRRFIPDPEFHAIIDAALAEGDNRP